MADTTLDGQEHHATGEFLSFIDRLRLVFTRIRNRSVLRVPQHMCETCTMPLETPQEIAVGHHLGANEMDCHLTYATLHSM